MDQHADHQRQAVDDVLAQRLAVTREDRRGHAAGAGRENVHRPVTRDRRDDLDRLPDRLDVGVHAPVCVLGLRVSPADHERLDAVAGQVIWQALVRRQVHDVVLVDLRRHDEGRPLVHAAARVVVLDQLEHPGPEDHLPGRRGEIPAYLERPLVHHRGHAAVVADVPGEVAEAGEEARTASVDEALDRGRVAEEIVGRRHRVGNQPGDHAGLAGVDVVETGRVDPLVETLAEREIHLQQVAVNPARLPGRVAEAAILLRKIVARLAECNASELLCETQRYARRRDGLPEEAG